MKKIKTLVSILSLSLLTGCDFFKIESNENNTTNNTTVPVSTPKDTDNDTGNDNSHSGEDDEDEDDSHSDHDEDSDDSHSDYDEDSEHEHIFEEKYSYDGDFHWKKCTKCSFESEKENHNFVKDEESSKKPTFDEYGYDVKTCSVCGYRKTTYVSKLEHKYSDESYDSEYHYQRCIDEGYEDLVKKESHYYEVDSDGYFKDTCKYCGYKNENISYIKFELDNDSYYVVNGCKNLKLKGDVEIPSIINGYPVTAISSLQGEKVTSIKIPNGVTRIGGNMAYGFSNCTSLVSIEIPNSVTLIGEYAFSNCTSLTSVRIPNTIDSLWNSTFSNCTSLNSVEIPDSVTYLGNSVFSNCSSLTSIEIPEGAQTLMYRVFYNCTSLTSIIIPVSVTSVYDTAFSNCTSLIYFFYKGTEEDWISVDNYALETIDNILYFYSETQPTKIGRYWHYDENNDPTIW